MNVYANDSNSEENEQMTIVNGAGDNDVQNDNNDIAK